MSIVNIRVLASRQDVTVECIRHWIAKRWVKWHDFGSQTIDETQEFLILKRREKQLKKQAKLGAAVSPTPPTYPANRLKNQWDNLTEYLLNEADKPASEEDLPIKFRTFSVEVLDAAQPQTDETKVSNG